MRERIEAIHARIPAHIDPAAVLVMDAHLALMVETWAAIIDSCLDSPNEP
ncbi:hypothetical protein [Nocardia nova]|nr:hypothetical protein [Nocardia nova]